MERLLVSGLETAEMAGAAYAELTGVEIEEKRLFMENSLLSCHGNREVGISVRLIANGRWGFAAGPATNKTAVAKLVKAALAGAKTLPKPRFSVALSPILPARGSWEGTCAVDPFSIPDCELAEILTEADRLMAAEGPDLRHGNLHFRREQRQYCNSEGSSNRQAFTHAGGGVSAQAYRGGKLQRRSYPVYGCSYSGAGYEYIDELDLPENAKRIAQETVALTKAPPCPPGVLDVIFTGPLLACLLHHTVSCNLQLAMPSCFGQDVFGKQVLASRHFSLLSDATLLKGAGSYGFDWEGAPAQSFSLVEEGRVVNHLSGRETAAATGRFSNGNMRSDCWLRPPSPRGANVVIKPGASDLASLIGGIERGIMMDVPRSSPRYPQRSLSIWAELGWLIEDGRIAGMVSDPYFRCSIDNLWKGCDAVASVGEQRTFGLIDEAMAVGYQVVPLRVRGVRVGDSR